MFQLGQRFGACSLALVLASIGVACRNPGTTEPRILLKQRSEPSESSSVQIRARPVDGNTLPFSGCIIRLSRFAKGKVEFTNSRLINNRGKDFSLFHHIEPGDIHLEFRSTGFLTAAIQINLKEHESLFIDALLKPDPNPPPDPGPCKKAPPEIQEIHVYRSEFP